MEKELTKHMIDWLQQEYGNEFDFKKIEPAIELMLKNYRRKILEDKPEANT